jgi:hypothetical protein
MAAKESMTSQEAAQGERMIEVKLRFWSANLGDLGRVVPKHAWTSGVVRMERSERHGIVPGPPRPFQSLPELSGVIEKVLTEHGVTLHVSKTPPPKARSLKAVGTADPDDQWEDKLEEFGVENVRIALTNNTFLPVPDKEIVWRWLREKDAARYQMERALGRWTLTAAVIAAVAATPAAIASITPLVGF